MTYQVPPAFAKEIERAAQALGESPETIFRLALRVGLAELPGRLCFSLGEEPMAALPEPAPEPPKPEFSPPDPGPLTQEKPTSSQFNLANEPVVDDLRTLLSAQDDNAGHHVLWVTREGDVRIQCLSRGYTPAMWGNDHEGEYVFTMSYRAGGGDMGPQAAEDDAYVLRLFADLMRRWEREGPV